MGIILPKSLLTTSKLHQEADISHGRSLGFRGFGVCVLEFRV